MIACFSDFVDNVDKKIEENKKREKTPAHLQKRFSPPCLQGFVYTGSPGGQNLSVASGDSSPSRGAKSTAAFLQGPAETLPLHLPPLFGEVASSKAR